MASNQNKLAEEGAQSVNIKVTSQVAIKREVFFKIKVNCRLSKLFTTYCQNQNLDYKTMRFLYHGQRILAKHTPKSLKMKDGDEIDAMTHANGGGT